MNKLDQAEALKLRTKQLLSGLSAWFDPCQEHGRVT